MPHSKFQLLLLAFAGLMLGACGGSSSGGGDTSSSSSSVSSSSSSSSSKSSSSSSSEEPASGIIKVNQLGFFPAAQKLAVVPDVAADSFIVVEAGTDTEVFTGSLTAAEEWDPADQSVKIADFSGLNDPGEYEIRVEGTEDSPAFSISATAYSELNEAALKAYYFNRASTALDVAHAGIWARQEGHPDTNVQVHVSAATAERPAGTVLEAPKGWYDAGDYGKYVVNSGISVYTLLAAYEQFPDYYAALDLNIPESGDTMSDILDEAWWNIEWMLAMQDTDGGVYHKLTTLNFAGAVMPHETNAQRYMIGKGTSATLNFAAVMAQASRIWRGLGNDTLADQMLTAAENAWTWAEANPEVRFTNPSTDDANIDNDNDVDYDNSVSTGEYGGNNLKSNFAWAAAELYITTKNESYYQAFEEQNIDNGVPGWGDSRGLAWMSLAFHGEQGNLTAAATGDLAAINQQVVGLAETLANSWSASAYRVPMSSGDFYWGSNSNALNRAMMLLQGFRLSGDDDHKNAAQSLLDYVLGRNPTDYSYVTGYGDKTPMDPHHRPSYADGVAEPVPGFVVGGPNTDYPADCGANNYPAGSEAKAKAYLDDWCSYSTNEVTINWNAPLVFVTGALQAWSVPAEE